MPEVIPKQRPDDTAPPVTRTRKGGKDSDTAEFFLKLNAQAAGVTPKAARRMTMAELDMLADLNPLLVGS